MACLLYTSLSCGSVLPYKERLRFLLWKCHIRQSVFGFRLTGTQKLIGVYGTCLLYTSIQVKAFEYVVKNGLLKHNVKFIFEGEEEIGSPNSAYPPS